MLTVNIKGVSSCRLDSRWVQGKIGVIDWLACCRWVWVSGKAGVSDWLEDCCVWLDCWVSGVFDWIDFRWVSDKAVGAFDWLDCWVSGVFDWLDFRWVSGKAVIGVFGLDSCWVEGKGFERRLVVRAEESRRTADSSR